MTNQKHLEEILIVEDSPTQAERLKYVLEQHGYRVSMARNGREAMDSIANHKPDLVISDILMPEADGYEVCRFLRQHQALQNVPVILLTALSDPVDVMRALECGADNFLIKPFEEDQLLKRVQLFLLNHDLRKPEGAQVTLEIIFQGQKYFINSDRLQILNLLLSTYEAAVEKNSQLLKAQKELEAQAEELETQSEELRAQNEDLVEMAQELQKRTTELEAANKELESFSYSVSHDLRAPLRGIAGFARMLADEYGEKLDAKGLEYLQMLQRASGQMNGLIEALLGLSRVSRAEMRRQAVDMSALARSIAENLKKSEPERQVEFIISDGIVATGDPALLQIMLENLLGNAWKFTGKMPQARIEFGVQDTGGARVYLVRDNGVGFDMKYAGNLFGAFQRLHAANEFPGTGIGLATVQRVINRHGGRIWTEAAVNQGAAFYFTLGADEGQ